MIISVEEFKATVVIDEVSVAGGRSDHDSLESSGRVEFRGVARHSAVGSTHSVSIVAEFQSTVPHGEVGTLQTFEQQSRATKPAYHSNVEAVLPAELFRAVLEMRGYVIDFEAINILRRPPFENHIVADIRRIYLRADVNEAPFSSAFVRFLKLRN